MALWTIVSEFNQFTVWPTLTVTGLGENTLFLIVTVSTLGGFAHSGFVGVGVHGAVGLVALLDELPHPIAKNANRTAPTVNRVTPRFFPMRYERATSMPPRQAGLGSCVSLSFSPATVKQEQRIRLDGVGRLALAQLAFRRLDRFLDPLPRVVG